jgi:hypothetical protein
MTTAALATVHPFRRTQTPHSMHAEVWRLAQNIAKSGMYPKGKSEHSIFVTMLTGMEMGLSPIRTLRTVQITEGRPAMSASSLLGLVKQSSACLYFMMVESTRQYAIYETQRPNDPKATRYIYTAEDAELTGKEKNPAAMLRSRCALALARLVYPDITAGINDQTCEDESAEGTPEALPAVSLPTREEKQPILISREELHHVRVDATAKEELLSLSDSTKRFILEDLYKKADATESVENLRSLVKAAQNAAKENILTVEQLSGFIEHCKKYAAEIKKNAPVSASLKPTGQN